MQYSIAITTYKYRFTKWLKPLIETIKSFRPEVELLIAINGENNEPFDESYRKEVLQFASQQKNTFVTMYPNFRGLSKLWNNLLINSSNHKVLLLNDDISITDPIFFEYLENLINQNANFFKINGSWSHAFLDRRVVNEVGWFDERLLSIGEEDGDFEWRFGSLTDGKNVPSVYLPGIVNHVDHSDCLVGMKKVNNKYSKFNLDFMFNEKYKIDDSLGKNYGIMNRKVVCINPAPNQHPSEFFYWNNMKTL